MEPVAAEPDTFYYDDFASEDEDLMDDYSTKNVPIWLSLCLVVAYIVWGAFIFQVGISFGINVLSLFATFYA